MIGICQFCKFPLLSFMTRKATQEEKEKPVRITCQMCGAEFDVTLVVVHGSTRKINPNEVRG